MIIVTYVLVINWIYQVKYGLYWYISDDRCENDIYEMIMSRMYHYAQHCLDRLLVLSRFSILPMINPNKTLSKSTCDPAQAMPMINGRASGQPTDRYSGC